MTFVAVIDPNWLADAGGGGRGAQNHYELAGLEGIARGYTESEAWRNDGPALVFMWATASAFATGDAHRLAGLLRLRVCAGLVWAKVERIDWVLDAQHDRTIFAPHTRMGLGQWTRCEHEHLLICRRGDVKVPETADRPRSMIYAPRGEHSAKPEEAWQAIERIVYSGGRGFECAVEFNARKRRPGWQAVGRLDGEDQPVRWEK